MNIRRMLLPLGVAAMLCSWGCAQTITTPGGVEGVYAAQLEGAQGTWQSCAEMTQFRVRQTDSSTYLVSNDSLGYEGEEMQLFAFRFDDRVYVEQTSPRSAESPHFYYSVWDINGNTLRVVGGNAPFPESWNDKSILPPGEHTFDVPVTPEHRAEVLDAMFDYILQIWPENAPGRFERVK